MNVNFDVVVIGGGPVGLATACFIKAANKSINVCVLDKRINETRNQALFFGYNTIGEIKKPLFDIWNKLPLADQHAMEKLIETFLSFNWRIMPIKEVVDEMTKAANDLGVSVLRGGVYEVSNLAKLLDSNEKGLPKLFQAAKVIIGADGPASVVRKEVMKDNFLGWMQWTHMIELQFLVDEVILHSLHLSVEPATYEKLPQSADPFNLEELNASQIPEVALIYKQLKNFTTGLESKGKKVSNEKVLTAKTGIYRTANSALLLKERVVLLVGDSESCIIPANGFNKGVMGAVYCAKAVVSYLSGSPQDVFLEYDSILKSTI